MTTKRWLLLGMVSGAFVLYVVGAALAGLRPNLAYNVWEWWHDGLAAFFGGVLVTAVALMHAYGFFGPNAEYLQLQAERDKLQATLDEFVTKEK